MDNITRHIIEKAISIWLNEPNFDKSYPKDLIDLMRGEYDICDEAPLYTEIAIALFDKIGYVFSKNNNKKIYGYLIGSCDMKLSEGLSVWATISEYYPPEDTLEHCLDWLAHHQKHKDKNLKDLIHIGDCTKFPASCRICIEDLQLRELRMFITMICWNGLDIVKKVSNEL